MYKFSNRLIMKLPLTLLLAGMSCNSSQPTGSTSTSATNSAEAANYRDLNKNGSMDVYEDSSQPVEARANDLLAQMTVEEKAGMMFINGTFINEDGTIEKTLETKGMAARLPTAGESISGKMMNHFNFWDAPGTRALATGYNAIQKAAENTRLGIPVTIASDPRNHFSESIFSMAAVGFSQWCETLGLAAIGDEALTRQFGLATFDWMLLIGRFIKFDYYG